MGRLTAGRAEVIAAQAVADIQGTAMILTANTPGSAFMPESCIGMNIFSPNANLRVRFDNHASTAVIPSGHLVKDIQYAFALNPGVSFVSIVSTTAGTPLISWVIGGV